MNLNRINLNNLRVGAEGAYAILWSDMVALRRCLLNYLIATVVAPCFTSLPLSSVWAGISRWTAKATCSS